MLASDGNLYGTTPFGGQFNCGVVYKTTPSGAFSVMHGLNGQADGQDPINLLAGRDGNLYGATLAGGTVPAGTLPGGAVFKVTVGLPPPA